METEALQGSLVSPILFPIYLTCVFREVERELEGYMTTSFADDCGWLVTADSLEQLCQWLERAGMKAVEWGERNHVAFYNLEDKMLAFTRHRKPDLKGRLCEARITARGYTLEFNTEAIQRLGVYLDTSLQFMSHKSLSLEKARRAEDGVRRLGSGNGLAQGWTRKI